MSKTAKYLLFILITWVVGCWLYFTFCCKCEDKACTDSTENCKNTPTNIQGKGFGITDSGFDYATSANFKFENNNFKTIMPLSDSIDLGIDKLKTYLSGNKKSLKITGYALSSEKNTTIYENLGLARAVDVKNYFVSKGISADRIDVFGELQEGLSIVKDTLYEPLNFELFEPKVDTEAPKVDYAALRTKINAAPLTMYFKTGETSINLSEEDRKQVAEMLNYLDNVKGSKLVVTGHTDNVGKRETNLKLGLDRANFALNYLVENGISKDVIEASTKGPDEPIADNKTKEGKDKNRRAVVSIK